MKLSTVLSLIPTWYETGICYDIRGPVGQGKSDTAQCAPKILEKAFPGKRFGIRTLNCVSLTPMDLYGFGLPKHDDGRSIMVFSEPFFWVTDEGKPLTEYDGGIILFEEIDKGDIDVKKIVYEGSYSGWFGSHKLPKGWVVWFTGNRAEDRSGATKELDYGINRVIRVDITPDPQGWADWCVQNSVMPVTIAFGINNTQIVWPDKLPDKQGAFCTPRSLVRLDRYFQVATQLNDGNRVLDDASMEIAGGAIGREAAAQYFVHLRLDSEMPSYEDIVKNPTTCKAPKEPDAQMLVCYKLATSVKPDDAKAVITYIERLPKDFAATFARSAIKRDPTMVMLPAFQQWAMRNSHLLTLINKTK